MRSLKWLLLCLSMLLLGGSFAQQNTAVHPAKDTPELYMSFFFLQEDFARWTNARVAADSVHKSQIVNSSAKYLGISPSEFAKVETVAIRVTASLRALSEEAHTQVQSAVQDDKRPMDHGALAAFDNRRRAIILAGIDDLKNSLSEESWQGLYSYINNQHRQHVNVNLPGPKAP